MDRMEGTKTSDFWIQTIGGKAFDFVVPDPESIQIEEIAHALSHQCRYTGHVHFHYSVAEHSVWVSREAAKLAGVYVFNHTSEFPEAWQRTAYITKIAKAGLMHDAAEAFLQDLASPVKWVLKHNGDTGYAKLEQHINKVLMPKFGLEPEMAEHELVKRADYMLLATEKPQVLGKESPRPWVGMPPPMDDPPMFGLCDAAAKIAFLNRFHQLWG